MGFCPVRLDVNGPTSFHIVLRLNSIGENILPIILSWTGNACVCSFYWFHALNIGTFLLPVFKLDLRSQHEFSKFISERDDFGTSRVSMDPP